VIKKVMVVVGGVLRGMCYVASNVLFVLQGVCYVALHLVHLLASKLGSLLLIINK
jgi:hypothetical protein